MSQMLGSVETYLYSITISELDGIKMYATRSNLSYKSQFKRISIPKKSLKNLLATNLQNKVSAMPPFPHKQPTQFAYQDKELVECIESIACLHSSRRA